MPPDSLERYTERNRPTLVLYKNVGTPPLVNLRYNESFEYGIELYLPGVGETLDGGVRDPKVLLNLYDITSKLETSGASIGLERLMRFILAVPNIEDVSLF